MEEKEQKIIKEEKFVATLFEKLKIDIKQSLVDLGQYHHKYWTCTSCFISINDQKNYIIKECATNYC